MSQMTTILCGTKQAYTYAVLFQSAEQWVRNALAEADVQVVDHLQAASEHVLLLGAPCPELTADDYQRLMQTHRAIGADFTVFASTMPLCGADGTITTLGADTLPVVCTTKAEAQALLQDDELLIGVQTALQNGKTVEVVLIDPVCVVKDGSSAFEAQKRICARINDTHIQNGVQIFAPDSVYIAPDAKIGAGTVILPGTMIREGCEIGCDATIGPNTLLQKATIGARTSINSSQVYESTIGCDATVGPFAYIRPDCIVGDHTRIGDFVELKKSSIGNGTKVSHLTYIGDATVGERVNFGCGTVVVNYDGYHKNHTYIGDDCFIGCNTNLVSPVKLGQRVFTAAGTTVTKDVPDGALAVARARQTTLEGWNDRRRTRMEQEK